jgi:hypothetical protein
VVVPSTARARRRGGTVHRRAKRRTRSGAAVAPSAAPAPCAGRAKRRARAVRRARSRIGISKAVAALRTRLASACDAPAALPAVDFAKLEKNLAEAIEALAVLGPLNIRQ